MTPKENYLEQLDRVSKMDVSGLISDLQIDENGNQVREVGGKKIIQIEEKTEADRKTNEAINRWRLRNR